MPKLKTVKTIISNNATDDQISSGINRMVESSAKLVIRL